AEPPRDAGGRHGVGPHRAEWNTVRLPRIIAVALVVAVATGACSSGSSKPHTAPGVTGTRASELSLNVTAADLVGPDKPMAPLVVAKLSWRVHSPNGSLLIERSGELTLTPLYGKWLVSAYDIAVKRVSGGLSTTTTAVKQ